MAATAAKLGAPTPAPSKPAGQGPSVSGATAAGGGIGGATASFGIKGTIGSNDTLTLTPQVSVGGSGGAGNTGGQVTVDNYAAISAAGTKSYGIEAQSVGGVG